MQDLGASQPSADRDHPLRYRVVAQCFSVALPAEQARLPEGSCGQAGRKVVFQAVGAALSAVRVDGTTDVQE